MLSGGGAQQLTSVQLGGGSRPPKDPNLVLGGGSGPPRGPNWVLGGGSLDPPPKDPNLVLGGGPGFETSHCVHYSLKFEVGIPGGERKKT